ncbi:helix-turn-helix domain-containing protein [Draconibacterium sediminis]|uniref:helix-turn-helix domain-containing protein n=1 Tax=Draconibacterium sediminis TaxID=1544798 RepID=UPI000695C458|nr:helix-turn-helix domain-containing protein [Draconibacterium sediminis]
MAINNLTPITPELLYDGLVEKLPDKKSRMTEFIRENKSSGNSYMDLFAQTVRVYGKRDVADYGELLGVNYRHLDGAVRWMSGMGVHAWMTEYLRLVACDLVEHTDFSFKEIGKIMGFSQSSFSQFFRAYQKMQAWEYRNLKQHGRKRRYFRR